MIKGSCLCEEIKYEYQAEESFANHTGDIKLSPHSVRTQGLQILIQTTATNNALVPINSLRLEAELFDKDGTFVYECGEYVSNKIEPGKTENVQIQCGCSKNGLPEYASITLKVTNATTY